MQKITILGIDGKPIEKLGTVIEEKKHGYDLASGGWALYKAVDENATPATFFIVRWYRRKKLTRINKKNVISVTEVDKFINGNPVTTKEFNNKLRKAFFGI